MVLFYVTIPIMVLMVVLSVLPMAVVIAYERHGERVTPEQIARAAADVRSGPDLESELIRRAEAIAAGATPGARAATEHEPVPRAA